MRTQPWSVSFRLDARSPACSWMNEVMPANPRVPKEKRSRKNVDQSAQVIRERELGQRGARKCDQQSHLWPDFDDNDPPFSPRSSHILQPTHSFQEEIMIKKILYH